MLGGLDPELSPIQIVALCADVRQVNEAEWDEVVWLWTRRPRAWLWKTLMRYQAIFGLTLAAVSLFLINRELPSQILEFWLLLVLLFALISLQEAAYGRWHADYCAAVRRAL